MRFYRLKRFLSARLDKQSVKIRKESEKAKMGKKQKKNTLVLSYFAKQRKKESTEIKEFNYDVIYVARDINI